MAGKAFGTFIDRIKAMGELGDAVLHQEFVKRVKSGDRAGAAQLAEEAAQNGIKMRPELIKRISNSGTVEQTGEIFDDFAQNSKNLFKDMQTGSGVKVLDTAPKDAVRYRLPSEFNNLTQADDVASLAPQAKMTDPSTQGGILDKLDRYTSRPLRTAARAMLTGEDPIEAAKAGFEGKQDVEGSELARPILDVLSERGMLPRKMQQLNPLTGEMSTKHGLEDAAGLATEMALDATNVIPGGAMGKVLKKLTPDGARKFMETLAGRFAKGQNPSAKEVMDELRRLEPDNPIYKQATELHQGGIDAMSGKHVNKPDDILEALDKFGKGSEGMYITRDGKEWEQLMKKRKLDEYVNGTAGLFLPRTRESFVKGRGKGTDASVAFHEAQHRHEFDKYPGFQGKEASEVGVAKSYSSPREDSIEKLTSEITPNHHKEYPANYEVEHAMELAKKLGKGE